MTQASYYLDSNTYVLKLGWSCVELQRHLIRIIRSSAVTEALWELSIATASSAGALAGRLVHQSRLGAVSPRNKIDKTFSSEEYSDVRNLPSRTKVRGAET